MEGNKFEVQGVSDLGGDVRCEQQDLQDTPESNTDLHPPLPLGT